MGRGEYVSITFRRVFTKPYVGTIATRDLISNYVCMLNNSYINRFFFIRGKFKVVLGENFFGSSVNDIKFDFDSIKR